MTSSTKASVCVLGAGFFGSLAALKLAEAGHQVHLLERADDILQGASKHNHNRIHFGYHYLRSVETARDSREGLQTFSEFFGDAICSNFTNYYAIAAEDSKSSPEDFEAFCDKVGIAYAAEYPSSRLLNPERLAACYRVPEPVFDYGCVHAQLTRRLALSNVVLRLNTEVARVRRVNGHFSVDAPGLSLECDVVVNCTYNGLNRIREMLDLPSRHYLFEDVAIPVLRYAHPMVGLTVMDGEFCSVMPRGMRPHEFLLYHVKHSVLARNLGETPPDGPRPVLDEAQIVREAATYMPFVRDCAPIDHYRWMRVVLENDDDARRSIVSNDAERYWSVLSGKVTTCVDVANLLVRRIAS